LLLKKDNSTFLNMPNEASVRLMGSTHEPELEKGVPKMDDTSIQKDIPQRQVPLHLLSPYHLSNGDLLLAIGAKHRCARESVLTGDDLAALTRVMNAVMRAASPSVSSTIPYIWTPGPIEIVVPRDLAIEDLFLAEQLMARLREKIPQLEAEVVEKMIKALADAYRWEIGKGPAPEPVIPADACADLDYNWVEAYLVHRWTTRERNAPLSAGDLARLAAQHFGVIEEESGSLPFRVMAEEVMRFYPTTRSTPSDEEEA
jgi:hypothetical protein